MFWRKKEVKEHLIEKQVPYRGQIITLWVDEHEGEIISWGDEITLLYFDAGWRAVGYGYGSRGMRSEKLETSLLGFVEEAKKYIDAALAVPGDLQRTIETIDKMDLKV